MAKLEQFHNNMTQKFEKTNIRTQLITNAEISQNYQKNFHYNNNLKNPSLPPIEKPIFRQGSKDSDQLSSGYRSGRSGSLPSNSSNELVNENDNDHYDLDYCKPALVDPKTICLKGKPPRFHNLAQEKTNNHQKLSLSSSINDYSNIEHEMLNKPFGTPSSSTSSIASHDIYSLSSSYAPSNIDCGYQKSSKERAKWGSYMYDPFLPKDTNGRNSNNGPVWLEKSLSEARDSEEETMSVSVKSDVRSISSFLRGQNVHVDPSVMLERENKRRKAMELQDAIKDQLRERELQKKIEKENKIREEKIEEARLNKQMQLEHERLQKEQNIQQEKLNNERKKQEVMKLALEKATLEAQAEREKRKRERTLANQSSLDETISIERTGEKTEIFMEGCETSQEQRDEWKEQSQSPVSHKSLQPNIEEDEDGETVLIGTPIKLKKKNLELYRRKVYKRQTNFEENYRQISEDNTYNSQTSTPKSTSISMDTSSELSSIKAPHKLLSEIDGVGLLLQTLQPLVPFQMTNDLFGLNQLNLGNLQLALLVQQQQQLQLQMQSRMSTPASVYLPSMTAPSPPCVSNRIKSPMKDRVECKEVSPLEQPKECQGSDVESVKNEETASTVTMSSPRESIKSLPVERPIPTTVITSPIKSILKKESAFGNPYMPPDKPPFILLPQETSLPHDGTFTRDENFHKLDAYTSTEESLSVGPNKISEIRILTPNKYRTSNDTKVKVQLEDTGTQTESSCEFCCYHSHCNSLNSPGSQNSIPRNCCNLKNNNQSNCGSINNQEGSNNNSLSRSKSKEKSSLDNRPKWGVNKPSREFVKASERDPFVTARNRRKRYAKKVVDSSDDSCNIRDCPIVSLNNNKKFTNRNICSEILPIKTDRNGRVYLVTSEENFLSYRRQQSQLQKQITIKNNLKNSFDKNSFLNENYEAKFYVSKRDDFQNIFSD